MSKQNKNQASKQQFGTETAKFDANKDYSTNTKNQQAGANNQKQQQASKSKYGTLTAKSDANNDYE